MKSGLLNKEDLENFFTKSADKFSLKSQEVASLAISDFCNRLCGRQFVEIDLSLQPRDRPELPQGAFSNTGNILRYSLVGGLAKFLPKLDALKKLNLANNLVGDMGLKPLFEALSTTQLVEIDLNNNLITDEGAKNLAAALKDLDREITINLAGNDISVAGVRLLMAANNKLTLFGLESQIKEIKDDELEEHKLRTSQSPPSRTSTPRLSGFHLPPNRVDSPKPEGRRF